MFAYLREKEMIYQKEISKIDRTKGDLAKFTRKIRADFPDVFARIVLEGIEEKIIWMSCNVKGHPDNAPKRKRKSKNKNSGQLKLFEGTNNG